MRARNSYKFSGGAIIDRPGGWQNMLLLLSAVSATAAATTVWFALRDADAAPGGLTVPPTPPK